MRRYYYSNDISGFLQDTAETILGSLVSETDFAVEVTQTHAWLEEIKILKAALSGYEGAGAVYFEYSVPRLGRRIDVVAIACHVIFVLEFKVGEHSFTAAALDQVWDYALDLKNFHETSHKPLVAPILVATESPPAELGGPTSDADNLLVPLKCNAATLADTIRNVLQRTNGPAIDARQWEQGRYYPTPTIIEAATSLYSGHSVAEISRSDASAINLTRTSTAVSEIIQSARSLSRKAICFVTGVPGAGKTLVGLNIANKHIDKNSELYSVFLSGNGPLVAILREALARDRATKKRVGRKGTKGGCS
jgi:hypothetical protein